jgi:hypothetical protein
VEQKHKDEAAKYLPDDEIDTLCEACSALFSEWRQSAPKIESFDAPLGTDVMDKMIRKTLVALTRKGIEKSMSKLALISIWVFDPDNTVKDWNDPAKVVDAVLFNRIGDSDTFLTEMRDIRWRIENRNWTLSFRDDHGTVLRHEERTFPFWPREVQLGLDTPEKAYEYYLGECKTRGLA